ncbi:Trypsin Inhibitor like cysteine rich domain [Popillia japonica]|uniref:Trypsin Inhibitor like cysteine rich domain n=1 Tax=Popillia japonica TaxID=7064 RepID=A0AAW1JII3_POPJA
MKLLVFVVLAYIATSSGRSYHILPLPPRCPPLMKYDSCGTACPRYCIPPYKKNYHSLDIKLCTLNCVVGCFCIPPYIYKDDKRNECVLLSDCLRNGTGGLDVFAFRHIYTKMINLCGFRIETHEETHITTIYIEVGGGIAKWTTIFSFDWARHISESFS